MVNLVIDTNILIAALIRDSLTRAIITMSGFTFVCPDLILEEVKKYKEEICLKSEISAWEYHRIFTSLLSFLRIIPRNVLEPFVQKAKSIMETVDRDDVLFIATALAIQNEGIWSDDKHFDEQMKVKVWKTSDLIRKILNLANE